MFAAGDVTRHVGVHAPGRRQGGTAATNALLGPVRRIDHRAVPWVTYTDPEVARVGLTADEGRAAPTATGCGSARCGTTAWTGPSPTAAPRLHHPGARPAGPRRRSDRGGTARRETIAHLATAVRLGWTASRYAGTVHPYPTYADGPWHAAILDVHQRLARHSRVIGGLVGLRRRVRP